MALGRAEGGNEKDFTIDVAGVSKQMVVPEAAVTINHSVRWTTRTRALCTTRGKVHCSA